MTWLDSAVAEWARWMGAASWQLALFTMFVGVAAIVICRLPARFRFGLWLLVMVKALLPPTLAAVWAVGAWGIEPARDSWPGLYATVSGSVAMRDAILAADTSQIEATLQSTPQAAPLAALPVLDWTPVMLGAFGLWLAGSLLVGFHLLRRSIEMRRLLRDAKLVTSGALADLLQEIAHDMGTRRLPALVLSHRAGGPFLAGIRRPAIVLPPNFAEQLDERSLRHVLAHEMAHYRRGDLVWLGLQATVQTVFWFHPMVWLAGAALSRERELACDEAVLALDRDGARDYGLSILEVAEIMRGRTLAALSFLGWKGRKTFVERRLVNIMRFRAAGPVKSAAAWSLIALFGFVFIPMSSPAVEPPPPENPAVVVMNIGEPSNVMTGERAARTPAREEILTV